MSTFFVFVLVLLLGLLCMNDTIRKAMLGVMLLVLMMAAIQLINTTTDYVKLEIQSFQEESELDAGYLDTRQHQRVPDKSVHYIPNHNPAYPYTTESDDPHPDSV